MSGISKKAGFPEPWASFLSSLSQLFCPQGQEPAARIRAGFGGSVSTSAEQGRVGPPCGVLVRVKVENAARAGQVLQEQGEPREDRRSSIRLQGPCMPSCHTCVHPSWNLSIV